MNMPDCFYPSDGREIKGVYMLENKCISVIVPVYKVEDYLDRCVNSILAQTYEDLQILLVDDGSPDGSGAMCDAWAARDNRIKVVHQENGGLSAARNTGIDWAMDHSQSRWLHFVDSDDWIHPRTLERLLEACQALDTAVCACGSRMVWDRSERPEDSGSPARRITPEQYFLEYEWQAATAWGKLYRKELFASHRYPLGKLSEDMFVTPFVLFAQESLALIEEPFYAYFQNSSSITGSAWTPRRMDALEGYEAELRLFHSLGLQKLVQSTLNQYLYTLLVFLRSADRKQEAHRPCIAILQQKLRNLLGYCMKARVSLIPFFRARFGAVTRKLGKLFGLK